MCNPPFWGERWHEEVVSVIGFGPLKSNFGHLKMGIFVEKGHFQVPKKGTSSTRTQKRRSLFHANIPPKWWNRHLLFEFLASPDAQEVMLVANG